MAKIRLSLSREILLAAAVMVGSLVLLPASIMYMGGRLFGRYQGGVKQFYTNLFHDLIALDWSAWVLVLVPALCVLIVRRLLRRPAAEA